MRIRRRRHAPTTPGDARDRPNGMVDDGDDLFGGRDRSFWGDDDGREVDARDRAPHQADAGRPDVFPDEAVALSGRPVETLTEASSAAPVVEDATAPPWPEAPVAPAGVAAEHAAPPPWPGAPTAPAGVPGAGSAETALEADDGGHEHAGGTAAADVDDGTQVSLPDVAPRGRVRARRRRARERRRRTLRRAGAATAAALALGAGVLAIATRDDGPDRARPSPVAPVPSGPPPVLLVVQGADGTASTVTLVLPRSEGGTVLFVPPGAMAEVASLGLEPVGRSLDLGGPDRLLATVENVVGVPIGDVQVVDADGVTALLDRAGELVVRIPERVEDVADDGTVSVLYEPGPTTVQPSEVAALLGARSEDGDLARLARHQAFWEAWLERIARDRSTLPRGPAGLRTALAALAGGDVLYRILPVEPLGTSAEDGELYRVLDDEVRALVAAAVPGTSASARPRVQVLNGTGGVQVAQRVADRLVRGGVQVKLTGNAPSFGYEQSQIIFYDRAARPAAERVRRALGAGRLVLSRRPLTVVDVTVIVGKDVPLE